MKTEKEVMNDRTDISVSLTDEEAEFVVEGLMFLLSVHVEGERCDRVERLRWRMERELHEHRQGLREPAEVDPDVLAGQALENATWTAEDMDGAS